MIRIKKKPKKYKGRSGASDLGREYEWKIATLLSLRSLHEVAEDWWIATNVDGVGVFDDFILNRGDVLYMLQLKHMLNPKNLKDTDYFSEKGDFSLKTCLSDISMINRKHKENEGFFKEMRAANKIFFALYTNRRVNEQPFLVKVENGDLDLLNTKSNASLHQFDYTNLPSKHAPSNADCCSNLYLYGNQIHANHLNTEIMAEMSKFPIVCDRELADKFTKFVEDWSKGNLGRHYCLSKNDVLCKLTDLFLDAYKVDFRSKPCTFYGNDCKRNRVWNDIIDDKRITVIDSDETVLKFLFEFIGNEVKNYYTSTLKRNWSYCLSAEEQTLFYDENDSLKVHMFKIIGNFGKITLRDIYQCLWMANKLPMLLEINSHQELETILRVLKLSGYLYKVILINKTGLPLRLKTGDTIICFATLRDLIAEQQQNILKLTVTLQGRPNAILGNLIDTDMFHHLNCRNIIKILQNNFNIGNDLPPLPKYHIERTLSKIFVKSEILKKSGNKDIFLIEGSSKKNLRLLQEWNLKTCRLEVVDFSNLKRHIIVARRGIPHKALTQLKSLTKPVHRFSIYDEFYLKWKGSFGSRETLKEFLVPLNKQLGSSLPSALVDDVTVVVAVPGMGKSVLMDCIALRTHTTKWVLKINLSSKHDEYFRSDACNTEDTEASTHLEYFKDQLFDSSECSNRELANVVFRKLVKQKDVIVFLDGFDEISVYYKEEVTNIAKSLHREGYVLWITTREFMKSHFEEHFDIFCSSLVSFTVDDQRQFLKAYFSTVNSDFLGNSEKILLSFVNKLLHSANTNMLDEDAEFTGIPLQSKLLAEYFNDECRKCLQARTIDCFNSDFNALKLYRNFIDKKIEILADKFGPELANMRKKFWEDQVTIFAVSVLFPQHRHAIIALSEININNKDYHHKIQDLQKDGILIVDEQFGVNFIHRTFAEFLAAKWLTVNCNSMNMEIRQIVEILCRERFTRNYRFLFNIFDRLLAEECPLHTALINGQRDEVTRILNITTLDEGRRSILHIAALYDFQYPPYLTSDTSTKKLCSEINVGQDYLLNILKKISENVDPGLKVDLLGCRPLDYALANRTFDIAKWASERESITFSNTIISSKLKDDYLISCIAYNYSSLFDVLLKYFLYGDVLLTNVSSNVTVRYYLRDLRKVCKRMYLKSPKNFLSYNSHIKKKLQLENKWYPNLCCAAGLGTKENVDFLLSRGKYVNELGIDNNTPLHFAVLHGKLETVKILLSHGASVFTFNIDGETALHCAVKLGSMAFMPRHLRKENAVSARIHLKLISKRRNIVKLLLSHGAEVNAQTCDRESPLHYLYKSGQYKVNRNKDFSETRGNYVSTVINYDRQVLMDLLIASGADEKIANKHGETVFHYIVENNYEDVLYNLLPKKVHEIDDLKSRSTHLAPLSQTSVLGNTTTGRKIGFDINTKNNNGDTLLHLASRKSTYRTVELLLVNGASNQIENDLQEIPVGCAIRSKQIKTIKAFCKHGSIDESDKAGNTALHLCLRYKEIGVAKFLICMGANVNIANQQGRTALHLAVENYLEKIIPDILLKTTDINRRCERGNTALHLALKSEQTSVAKLLISNMSDVNIDNDKGERALHHVARNCLIDVFKSILNKTNNIEKQDNYGNTPLHLSLLRRQIVISTSLIRAGADVNIQNRQGWTALHCVQKNSFEKLVNIIIDNGGDYNIHDAQGNTALHLYVMRKKKGLARFLIFKGANVNVENHQGRTPFHYAGDDSFIEFLDDIINNGGDINKQDEEGSTLLHLALKNKEELLSKSLIVRGADVDVANGCGRTALHIAVKKGLIELVKDIISSGVNINKQDKEGDTPLHLSLTSKQNLITEVLLSQGANVNVRNKNGENALHCASKKCKLKIVKRIFKSIQNINEQDNHGNTATHFSIMYLQGKVSTFLILQGSNIEIENREGETAFHCAMENKLTNVIPHIIRKVTDINKQYSNGNTLLHHSLLQKQKLVPTLLIDREADVNILNFQRQTALHCVAQSGLRNALCALLYLTNAINRRDCDGNTPLHLASMENNIYCVDLLLNKGANSNIKNKMGVTPLYDAALRNHFKVFKLLCEYANLEESDENGNTYLHNFVAKNKIVFVKILILNGAKVNVKNNLGQTPLHLAVESGWKKVFKILSKRGAVVNAQDKMGDTPLHLAIMTDDRETTKTLFDAGADVDLPNSEGKSAYSLAYERNKLEVINLLRK